MDNKRRANTDLKSATFKWPRELDARLGRYVVDLGLKEQRHIDRTEVVKKAVDEFLGKEGY